MNALIQRIALAFALFLGGFATANAATVTATGQTSIFTPYFTAFYVSVAETYNVILEVDAGAPFYLLLNQTEAITYSGTSGGGTQTLATQLDLNVGNHVFYAYSTSPTLTNFSLSVAPVLQMAPIPLPSTLPLMGAAMGLVGLLATRRRRKSRAA